MANLAENGGSNNQPCHQTKLFDQSNRKRKWYRRRCHRHIFYPFAAALVIIIIIIVSIVIAIITAFTDPKFVYYYYISFCFFVRQRSDSVSTGTVSNPFIPVLIDRRYQRRKILLFYFILFHFISFHFISFPYDSSWSYQNKNFDEWWCIESSNCIKVEKGIATTRILNSQKLAETRRNSQKLAKTRKNSQKLAKTRSQFLVTKR